MYFLNAFHCSFSSTPFCENTLTLYDIIPNTIAFMVNIAINRIAIGTSVVLITATKNIISENEKIAKSV